MQYKTLSDLSDDDLNQLHNEISNLSTRRKQTLQQNNMDVKFAYHTVRLLLEVEQIMIEHDLDIERNRELLKSIRRGEWTLDYLENWFSDKEKALETVYTTSTLQHSPNFENIRRILLECLEMHYGSLENVVQLEVTTNQLLEQMQNVIDRFKI